MSFTSLSDLLRGVAAERPDRIALAVGAQRLTYAAFDALVDRVAAALQRDGVAPGDAVAICAMPSIRRLHDSPYGTWNG